MANILFRGNVSPIQPAAVAAGSVAKGTPLTNDEGDWNYKALNDDIQTRAPTNNPSFTGVVSVNHNIRSVLAKYNNYVSCIDDTIPVGGCKIGEYLPAVDTQNTTIKIKAIARTVDYAATSEATIAIRSNTMPDVSVSIYQSITKTHSLSLSIEAWKDASTGKIVLFAVPTTTFQTLSLVTEVFERYSTNAYSQAVSNIAKNTVGLTQIAEISSVPVNIKTLLDTKAPLNGTGATGTWGISVSGNAATATKLATARTINGISFDGSANITIADSTKVPLNGTGATGTWGISISGNAATATTATYASAANSASSQWYSANIDASSALNDSSASMQVRNNGGTGESGLAAISFHCVGAYGTKLHLRADGYIGIGGWSRAAWSWYSDPNGNMIAAGNVTAYSDPRLKENFARIQDPMSIIEKLDGGTFNWRHGFPHIVGKAGKRDYGILADQVQAVMPEIVNASIEIDGESYLTVSYEKLVPVLIEAIRGLHARIKELEDR